MANKSIFADSQNGLLRNLKPLDLVGFMQILFDKYEQAEVAKFQETIVDRYFTYNPAQMGLTAEALMGQYHFRIMASVLGQDSKMPLRGTTGFSAWQHEIPRLGHAYAMPANRLRQLYAVLESVRATDTAKINQLQQTIFNNVQEAYLGCKDTLNYIFLQALSNNGVATFTPTLNNPQGVEYAIDYEMPTDNQKKSDVEWSTANSEAGKLSIFEQLQDVVREMEDKGINVGEIMLSPAQLVLIQRDKVVRKMIYGNDRSSNLVTLPDLNAALTQYGLPQITQIRFRTAIEKDGKCELVNPWNDDNIVFLPTGPLGEIQPAVEDSDLIPEENVSYIQSNDGIKVSQWSVGDSTGQMPTEYTQASGRLLPIITEIKGIYSLKVKNL